MLHASKMLPYPHRTIIEWLHVIRHREQSFEKKKVVVAAQLV